jgi:hypothetical protein
MWKNATGTAKSFDGKRVIKYGLVGSADLTGILSDGRRCDIEVKTGNAVQSPAQKNYQKMIEEMDGVYILARSTDDVIRVLDAKIIK